MGGIRFLAEADIIRHFHWTDGAFDSLALSETAPVEVGFLSMRAVWICPRGGSGIDHDSAMARVGVALQPYDSVEHFD